MWKQKIWAGAAVLGFALAASGCADDGSQSSSLASSAAVTADDEAIYEQVEFLGNPLVSEVTIMKVNHDLYNRTQPYNTATFLPQTAAFVTDAGRPLSLAQTLGRVLYPDILVVNTARDPSTSGWLSWALADGWGGRNLSDDVVDLGLTAIFSSFLESEGAKCEPFALPLCTDNVDSNDRSFSDTFPYLATPN
ncbi:MAG: DUF4331 family protein [Gemmatimonadales bacterium]